jgi:CRP-like cAMP-binding protein
MVEARLVDLLSTVPLFGGLKRKQVEHIAEAGKELTFEQGREVIQEGQGGVGFFLITDGEVEVRKQSKVLTRLGKGQFFGEMTLLDGQPRSADVVAVKPTKCFGLTSWAFAAIINTNPDVALNMMKELARRLREADERLNE